MRTNVFKGLLALLALLAVSNPAFALCTSYPNTLTNGTTADGGQVMANFNCAVLQSGATLNTTTLTGTTSLPGSGAISSTGSLGIGMTPSNILDVTQNQNAASKLSILNTNSSTASETRLVLNNGTHVGVIEQAGTGFSGSLFTGGPTTAEQMNVGTSANAPLIFGTNNTARVVVLGNGNVGVGTTTPATGLQITGGSSTSFNFDASASTSGYSTTFSMDNTGFKISDNSASRDIRVVANSGGVVLGVGATAWSSISDERLKKDISVIGGPDALAGLAKIDGITYAWRDRGMSKERQIGVRAQDVLKTFPQLIQTTTATLNGVPGKYYAVNYSGLVAPVISAVNELDRRTSNISAEIKDVPALIEAAKELKKANLKLVGEVSELKAANDNQGLQLSMLRTQLGQLQRQVGIRTARK
jgi:hypothetical protein